MRCSVGSETCFLGSADLHEMMQNRTIYPSFVQRAVRDVVSSMEKTCEARMKDMLIRQSRPERLCESEEQAEETQDASSASEAPGPPQHTESSACPQRIHREFACERASKCRRLNPNEMESIGSTIPSLQVVQRVP